MTMQGPNVMFSKLELKHCLKYHFVVVLFFVFFSHSSPSSSNHLQAPVFELHGPVQSALASQCRAPTCPPRYKHPVIRSFAMPS
jgi:hypothetical protein